jgi:ABC-2 type transport system ATP-binding protein
MNNQSTLEYALEAESVTKIYSQGIVRKKFFTALSGVSLQIPRGKIFGLLGPNGAGKTTLINVFAGQLEIESGRIRILGEDIARMHSKALRQLKTQINMCSGAPNFPWSFTVKEILSFYTMLYGMRSRQRKKKIDELISLLELGNYQNSIFDTLSSGTKQKVALAKALLNEPEILFLDEPTIGLDPDMAIKMRKLIIEINNQWNNTIVLTTHYMREAEELCGKIAFIKSGRIIAVGTSRELKDLTKTHNLEEVFLELSH